jgi:DNA-binding LacI/PurR family transcriptional regulator
MTAHYQIAMERIRAYLLDQQPLRDTRLPSEREFEQLLGITRPAANKAIACLIAAGVLRREGYKLYAGTPPPPPGPPPVHVLIPRGIMVNELGPLEAAHDVARERLSHAIPMLIRDAADERETLTRLLREKISGFVIWPNGPDCNVDLLKQFRQQGTPFVVCDQDIDDFDFVGVDNEVGTTLAVRHLVEQGHRNIAYLTRQRTLPSLVHRCAGYRQACQTAGLKQAADQVIEIPDITDALCAEAFATLQKRHPKATAFVASNDLLALQVIAAAKTAGMRGPEALSAVGFDDIREAGQATPALTTIRQDFYEIGYLATELLYQRLTATPPRDPLQSVRLRLEPRLIARGSVSSLRT